MLCGHIQYNGRGLLGDEPVNARLQNGAVTAVGSGMGAKEARNRMTKVTYTGKSAVISEDRRFRYGLTRTWDADKGTVSFILLNPSTADAEQDDATIRKCVGFAKCWGYGGIRICNLYAYRARDPKNLKAAGYPVGPENDSWLRGLGESSEEIIVAWGNHARPERVREVMALIGRPVKCLGVNRNGSPSHPVMLGYDRPLREWMPPEE